jgi:hypothetical protein
VEKKTLIFKVDLKDISFEWTRYHTERVKRQIKGAIEEYIFSNLELANKVTVINPDMWKRKL